MLDTIKAAVWDGKRKYIAIAVAVVVIGVLMYAGVDGSFVVE